MDNYKKEQAADFGSLFQELRTDLSSYINNKVKLYRLDFVERTSKSISLLAYILLAVFLGLLAMSFILVSVALFLGDALGSYAVGFGVVAIFWLLWLIVLFIFRDKIKNYLLHKTVGALYKIEKEDDDAE